MKNKWNGSLVMEEFAKIASSQGLISTNIKPEKRKDFVGNPSTPTPVKDRRRYEPTEEYKIKTKDLVQKSHPKKIQVVDSMGEGGVVENIIEQQKKDIDVATKMPTGALIGVHANLINELVNIANYLDNKGKIKEAKKIDNIIKKVSAYPFYNGHLYKKALWGQLAFTIASIFGPNIINWFRSTKTPYGSRTLTYPGSTKLVGTKGKVASGILAGMGILGMLGNRITTTQEGLKEDSMDLYDILQNSKSSSALKASQVLRPYALGFQKMNLSSERGLKEFILLFNKFELVLPEIESLIGRVQLEDPSITFLGFSSRIEAKLNSLKESIIESRKVINNIQKVSTQVDQNAQTVLEGNDQVLSENVQNNIENFQKLLSNNGFNVNVNGQMDEQTVGAGKELEKQLDVLLKDVLKGKSFVGKIISNGNFIADINELQEVVNEVKKRIS